MSSLNKKRIAKNTLLLYFRMTLTMLVSLYTSRVVLEVLGVEDFGVYGVVSGVIAMFSFLNAAMSGSTSRFLTFEMGMGNAEKLNKTFSAALTVHILIALTIVILGETVGLWFLENKLVIPAERMAAARWVYQLSIVSMVISIVRVPYNAAIIAHERMNIYAYVEILNSILRLGIAYLLLISSYDKLITYAVLVLIVSIIISAIYFWYCRRCYQECRARFAWEKSIINPMLSFSAWDLYSNLGVMGRTLGVNILLNLFFGPVLNAANTVAVQVQGTVLNFSVNVLTAVRPQIVKTYATGEHDSTRYLVFNTVKFTYILQLILSMPLILEMDFILNLWLKNAPDYAVLFCQLTLVFNLITTTSAVLMTAIHASGKIRLSSTINGTLYLMVLPITYIAFKFGGAPEIPYACNILFAFIAMLSNAYIVKRNIPKFYLKEFIFKVVAICILIFGLTYILTYLVQSYFEKGFLRLMIVIAVSSVVVIGSAYALAVDKQMKLFLKDKIAILLKKNKHE